MSAEVATDLTRVVLIAPHQTMELALPARVPLADLMPVLVQRATVAGNPRRSRRKSGRGRGRGRGLTGEGDWVLQRLGSAPLDEDQTLGSIPVYDGETLYLRPRDTRLPPAHFDDLIDGLATGIQGRPDRWREPMTRAMLLLACATVLGVCLVALLLGPYTDRAPMGGLITLLLVLGALVCARALGDGWGGVTLGLSAVAFAVVTGLSVLPEDAGFALSTPRLLCACGAATVTSMTVMYVVGAYRPAFLALWLAAGVESIGALLTVLGMTPAQSAGAMTVLVLVASTFAPSTAFRLARLRLPQLPTGASDLSDDIEPYSGPRIIAGAVLADTYLTWLSLVVGAVATAGLVVLARDPGASARWLVCTVSLVLMIRSRAVTSAWQRGALLLPATLGAALMTLRLANQPNPLNRLLAIVGLLTVATLMLTFSHTMPGRRLLPYWGRLVDVGEYLVALSMVLILLQLFGAYHWARALGG